MTDFIRDLEAELLAAARRRTARRRRSLLGPVLAAASALAAVLAALALVPRSGQPTPPEPAPAGVPGGFVAPLIGEPEVCDAGKRVVLARVRPERSEAVLGVLRRASQPSDAIPSSVQRGMGTWLPVGDRNGRARRVVALQERVFVLGTDHVLTHPPACLGTDRGPGACLVVPAEPRARCFTLDEIRAGRAFALLTASERGARLIGLVSDDVAEIELTVRNATMRVRAVENVIERYVRGLRADEPIRVRLVEPQRTVMIVGGRRAARAIADRVERALDVRTELSGAKGSTGEVLEVVPMRPGSGRLAEDVARLLGAQRVLPEPPARKAHVTPNTPDVMVWLRSG